MDLAESLGAEIFWDKHFVYDWTSLVLSFFIGFGKSLIVWEDVWFPKWKFCIELENEALRG